MFALLKFLPKKLTVLKPPKVALPKAAYLPCNWKLMLANLLFFYLRRYHAERAISIITKLFPEDHLLLASSKRVKGKWWCCSMLLCLFVLFCFSASENPFWLLSIQPMRLLTCNEKWFSFCWGTGGEGAEGARYWFPFKISSSLCSKRFRVSSSNFRAITRLQTLATQARLVDASRDY